MKKLYEEENIRAIAESIRGKTGAETTYTTATMPSGVEEVYEAGIDEGRDLGYTDGYNSGASLTNRTLNGVYILKEDIDLTDLEGYSFRQDFYGEGVYAHFYNNGVHTYGPVGTMGCGLDYPIYFDNDYEEGADYLRIMYIDLAGEGTYTWGWEIGGWNGDILPDQQGRIIVFTEPVVVTQTVYEVFQLISDNSTSEFITEDATAGTSNIHSGKTAYVAGKKIVGTAKTYDAGYDEGYAAGKIAAIEAFETSGLVDWEIVTTSSALMIAVLNNHPNLYLHITVDVFSTAGSDSWEESLTIAPLDSNSTSYKAQYSGGSWDIAISEMRFSENGV